MSGGEFVVEPDRWVLPRRQSVRLRGNRVLPGPLKALTPRHGTPGWIKGLGLGLSGLALTAAFTLTPRPVVQAVAEPTPELATNAAPEAPMRRVVGAAVAPVPVVAPTVADVPAAEQPALRLTAAEPAPMAPAPPVQRRAAAPALDLGQLPVLELDASAFEAPPPVEAAPRPPAKARTTGAGLVGPH